ncbi:hypothetical protein [Cohnella sp. GCM10027633]|uniref:putative amidoligase domain-containing protein n=1 Tax=unclassified Cohnella TaxID=2636738 RepID=UPI00362B89A3
MGDSGGQAWLARGKKSSAKWMDASGVPELRADARIRNNDCVLIVDDLWPLSLSVRGEGEEGPDGSVSPWLMNRSARRLASLAPAEIERRLRREGLAASIDGATVSDTWSAKARRFKATIFDLAMVDVHRVYDERYLADTLRAVASIDDRLRNIIAKAATRALYMLGLDYGEVEVELDDWARATIFAIRPRLAPSPGEAEGALAEAVSAFSAAWTSETKDSVAVTLGADPEFVMLAPDGRVVPASRFLPPGGDAGCDSVVIRGVRRWPLAELRPEPATEPAAVAASLRRLLTAAARRTAGAQLAWRAGTGPVRGLPLGGHVHLSGAALTGERLRALDNAVALPLRLLEPPSAAARRPRFGALGDFRRQSHGGFEYRTPPSWLVSPRLACGALALAKVAAEHSRELASRRPLDDDAVRDAFYSDGDRGALLAGAAAVHAALASTSGYRKYESLIEPLFRSIERGVTWNETADLRERWGITVK